MSSKCCAYFVLCLLLVVLPTSYANKNSKIEDNHANTLQFFNKLQHNIHTKTFFPAASSSQDTTTVSVQTPLGEVVGLEENGYRVFKGIPFAQPPINENRWAAPQPITQWNKTLQATQYPSACPQTLKNVSITPFITTQLSEDCLYLNIWTPKQSALPNNKKVPVMVWFHGGAFVTGWGGDGLFWGDYIVNSTSDTIVVTTNYRLGALASFNSPELTGNYGFLDQQMALQWVQEYISYFGGDSSQVTIFGQSAGAMSVTLHTLSPSSNGLFSRAIAESNPAGVNYRTPEENAVYSEKLGELIGCNYTDTACLRSKTWEEIVSVQTRVYEMTRLPLTTFEFLPYAPVIDGTIIPLQPMAAFRSGKVNSGIEAMVFGVCRNETLAFIPVDIPLREVVYKSIVQAVFGDNSTKVLSEYPGTRGSNLNQLSILTTDWLFLCASRFAATAFANSNIETFMYNFMHPPSNDPINASSPACDGAVCHSAELSFVRNSIDFVIPGSFTPAERKLSFGFVNYWINFAHGVVESNAFGPAWPAYNASTDVSLDFDIPTITTLQNYHADKCAFWDSFGYYN